MCLHNFKMTVDYLFHLLFYIVINQVCSKPATSEDKNLYDAKHGVIMGHPSHTCDDAKTRLEVDWAGSAINYTCFTPKVPIPVKDIEMKEECFHVPQNYIPQHHCMDKVIEYNESIPTFGDHRPLWPVYGEYNFVPRQRWLHNIEHGAVVMLYDPCAHPAIVKKLRSLVTSCLRRHVITTFNHLHRDRPLTLVAWGCRLSMNVVDEERVISFLKEKALKGPEGKVSQDGQYDFGLLERAQNVEGSDEEDNNICP